MVKFLHEKTPNSKSFVAKKPGASQSTCIAPTFRKNKIPLPVNVCETYIEPDNFADSAIIDLK